MHNNWTLEGVISELDSKRFGVTVAKVDSFGSSVGEDVERLKAWGVDLVISRISSDQIALINRLEAVGFLLKDTQLTFEYSLTKNPTAEFPEPQDASLIIEQALEADADRVGELSYQAFKGYGHYACNEKLDQNQANEIYRDWAMRSCVDRKVADHLLVARVDGVVAGFLSIKNEQENGNSTIVGVQHLGAVDSNFRSYGVFRNLVNGCLRVGRTEGHVKHRTFLQSINIPVIRSYLNAGFKNAGSKHTLHAWLK